MTNTVDQIIERLGGPAEIAKVAPFKDGAIRQWKFKGVIPRKAWPDLIEKFPGAVTMSDLLAAESKAAA